MDFYKETDVIIITIINNNNMIVMLKSLLSDRYGKLLFLYGKWNAELSSQSPNFIIELVTIFSIINRLIIFLYLVFSFLIYFYSRLFIYL
jgi:hypothetical protein